MNILLNQHEIRVLGSLLEKSMTTPDNYPLSLNALTNACSQKSNRDPVVDYDQETIVRSLDSLKSQQLVVQGDSSRVPKYSETFVSSRNLINSEAAVLMILMLRGPQTIGEIKSRTERSHRFQSTSDVLETINDLIEQGYVIKLPLQPGRKEPRYSHLLAGEPEIKPIQASPEQVTLKVRTDDTRIDKLHDEIEKLRSEIILLRKEFIEFKNEFE